MNRASPEMLHCLQTTENLAGNGIDMTLLERQRTRVKWQQQNPQSQSSQQPQQSYFSENQFNLFSLPSTTQTEQFLGLMDNDPAIREQANRSMKYEPCLGNGWPDLGKYSIPNSSFGGETTGSVSTGFAINSPEMGCCISRNSSCPPPPVAEEKGTESVLMASTVGRESFKKRKADKAHDPKVSVAEETKDKRMKGDIEEVESKITEQINATTTNNNKETSADTSKENSKVSEVQKPDYIHVRARRGQATDSHSLAERVRREKISERMKHLQDLVPGCNKITGKAGMLDEIINYVQSLQRQVEFLSMKLAASNPRLDFNIDNFFGKDMIPACPGSFPSVGMSSEMENPSYLQFNPVQQVISCGLDMAINPPDITHQRSTGAPVSMPESFLESSCFIQSQPSTTWETDLQSFYNVEFHQGRSTAFPSQPFPGTLEANILKMEM